MVEVLESTLVVPSEETPNHKLWLSNLDQVAARAYTTTVYLYRSNGDSDFFRIQTLKSSLSKTLVPFYPLAGRLGLDRTGRVEINCTGDGVPFVVARSGSTIDDFKDFAPSPEIRDSFVPPVESVDPPCFLVAFQVTFLRCGGVVLGVAAHHVALDGKSALLFIKTFSAITRGGINATHNIPPPFFDCTILAARSPLAVLFDHSYHSTDVFQTNPSSPSITTVLKLSRDQVQTLKNNCTNSSSRVSTFHAVAAYVWKLACIARRIERNMETQLYLPVDVRNRVNPPLPRNYMGNAAIRAKAVATVEEIVSNSPSLGAEVIKIAIDKITDEFVKSFIDHLETSGADKESLSKRGGLPRTSLYAVSWLELPIQDADFGWGMPELMARAQWYGCGCVYLMNSPEEEGGVSVVIALEEESMGCFKNIFYEEM
ncbi:putrescine hydroxycinnamoyltransferase 1-like [Typha latifolia]|uniref:putrescine hydroxycinnamoyltransferase 1-like n=1 Tax=Typha latifolia TaxID=4733 RepID=UPI003C2DA7F4